MVRAYISLFFRSMLMKHFCTNSWKCILCFFSLSTLSSCFNESKEVPLWKSLYFRQLTTCGFILGKCIFITATTILRKSESPVSITYVFLKLSGLFVNIKSMHVGFSGFLKHIGSFIRFSSFVNLPSCFHRRTFHAWVKVS